MRQTSQKRTAGWQSAIRWCAALFLLSSLVEMPRAEPSRNLSAEVAVSISINTPFSETGGDDIAKLKHLASGVGWEAAPNAETTAALRGIGIKMIRCINVDRLAGSFDASGRYVLGTHPARLNAHLATCTEIGAQPHIIIGQNVPDSLRLTKEEAKDHLAIMGQTPGKSLYWNGDWPRLRSYWKELFRYVLIERGFAGARFEVGNEPDIDGQFPKLIDGDGGMGSRKLYQSYFELYKNVALAAREFEQENPGQHVTLGGPALAWAYTFSFGQLNWVVQFLKDCSEEHVKLDFIGLHYYGNISSLHGEYKVAFPSFSEMLAATQAARNASQPGVPILFTEWGPSYHIDNEIPALVNAEPIGAAWSAEFLHTLLEKGVDGALFLTTTDFALSPQKAIGPMGKDVWGWPSFFTNPGVFGKAWPKPPFHLFALISRLAPNRIEARVSNGNDVGMIVSQDPKSLRITALLWNYRAKLPENGDCMDMGEERKVSFSLPDAGAFFGEHRLLQVNQWMVSRNVSDALGEYRQTNRITERSLLQLVGSEVKSSDSADAVVLLPSSSVALISWETKP